MSADTCLDLQMEEITHRKLSHNSSHLSCNAQYDASTPKTAFWLRLKALFYGDLDEKIDST